MKKNPVIYLASRSPRRRTLLHQIGISHALLEIDVDERQRPDEDPVSYVLRLATEKAKAGAEAVAGAESLPVLAADTSVVIKNRVLGKPRDREHGLWMLRQLSGKTHQVYTAVALNGRETETDLSLSEVSFRALSEAEITAYWATGEPADKAGSYAIQGVGARFISMLHGSYSGVMGLPLFETAELLSRNGIQFDNE
ncbi:MAG: septum formation protein Maf [gamma proteobacterium symbiont of Ctena orbiculata]|nr:MAG: septum formation protein Maf [gamma proteobacterium symbiont of Ctena orbiculata]PVV23362.1 MAG: septum formation protein Maf [gamma proteobacterium symbiont of Ctena orbiculata]PVV26016.1 MAG: septum formation protein Maf [gamma proteobacterium symbiont of Ctena orbiculata]